MAGNILETFFILFSSDSKEVDEGAKRAEGSTDKLERRLKGADKAAQNTGQSFAALARSAVNMLMPFVGLAALRGTVAEFAASADAAGSLADSLQIDIEALQAWQGVAQRTGGSAEGLAASMRSLDAGVREMRVSGGGAAAEAFYHLGLSIRDNEGKIKRADKLLLDLSDRFAGMSRDRALHFGEQLGLDEKTIALLQQGRSGLEALLARQKELGLYSKRDAQEARKFNNALADMGQAFRGVGTVLARALLPVLSWFAAGFNNIAQTLRRHKDLVSGFFIGLSAILGVLAIKATIAFAPFLLFAAVILGVAAAFAVFYDEVKNFMAGHDSMFGRIAQRWPKFGSFIRGLVATFRTLWDIISAVGTLLIDSISAPGKAWDAFKAKIDGVVDKIAERFPFLGQLLRGLGKTLSTVFGGVLEVLKAVLAIAFDIVGGVLDALAEIAGWIYTIVTWVAEKMGEEKSADAPINPFIAGTPIGGVRAASGAGAEEVMDSAAKAQDALWLINNTPAAALPHGWGTAGPGRANKNVTVKVDKMEVITQGTEAEGIGRDVGDAIQKQIESAADEADDGVAA